MRIIIYLLFFILFSFRILLSQNTEIFGTEEVITITNTNFITNVIYKETKTIKSLITNRKEFSIKGRVNVLEGGFVEKIGLVINNVFTNVIVNNGLWTYEVKNLEEGSNSIMVFSIIDEGIYGPTNSIYYIVDTKGPEISIINPELNKEFFVNNVPYDIKIEGFVNDPSGISKVVIYYNVNKSSGKVEAQIISNYFNSIIRLPEIGKCDINILAIDKLNNISTLSNFYINLTSRPKIKLSLSENIFNDISIYQKKEDENIVKESLSSEEITKIQKTEGEEIKEGDKYSQLFVIEPLPSFNGKWKMEDNLSIIIINNEGKIIKNINDKIRKEIKISAQPIGNNTIKIKEKGNINEILKFWYPELKITNDIDLKSLENKYYVVSIIDNNKLSVEIFDVEIIFDDKKNIKDIIPSIDKTFWIREK